MRIIEEVKRIVEAMGLSFHYESSGVANVVLDRSEYPCSLMFVFQNWSVNVRQGGYRESADILLFFLDKAEKIDFDGESNHQKIEAMKDYALAFIDEVIKGNVVEFVDDEVEVESVYDKFDETLTGVCIKTKLREKAGRCAPII